MVQKKNRHQKSIAEKTKAETDAFRLKAISDLKKSLKGKPDNQTN